MRESSAADIRIIPCLDVRAGRVVKGVQFQGLRDLGAPEDFAARYQDQGADELVMLHIAGSSEPRADQLRAVERVRARISIPLSVGGGISQPADTEQFRAAGADKVSVNSAAVHNPALIDQLVAQFGSGGVIVAVDARARDAAPDSPDSPLSPAWEVVTHGGNRHTGIDAIDWIRQAHQRGAGEILLTSWDRDGTGQGYDLALVRAASSAVPIPIIASGGAAGIAHIIAGVDAGARAILAASIFHDGVLTVAQVKDALRRSQRARPTRPPAPQ